MDSGRIAIRLDNAFIRVEEHLDRRVVVVRRSAVSTPADDPVSIYREVLPLVEPRYRQWGLVLDMRAIPGRNDTTFETGIRPINDFVGQAFARVVVLVRGAVGRLQVERYNRERGGHSAAVFDEDEAMAIADGSQPYPGR